MIKRGKRIKDKIICITLNHLLRLVLAFVCPLSLCFEFICCINLFCRRDWDNKRLGSGDCSALSVDFLDRIAYLVKSNLECTTDRPADCRCLFSSPTVGILCKPVSMSYQEDEIILTKTKVKIQNIVSYCM